MMTTVSPMANRLSRRTPVFLCLLTVLCSLCLAACLGGGEKSPLTCAKISCGPGGTCIDAELEGEDAVCQCSEGYLGARCEACAQGFHHEDGSAECVPNCQAGEQDNDGDGICEPDCSAVTFRCRAGSHCYDGFGTAVCICDDDYQDNDRDGFCQPSCALSECGEHALCDDMSGFIVCSCEAGYQDNDGNNTCEATCETANLTCPGEHAACTDAKGQAVCGCEDGYVLYQGTCTEKSLVPGWTILVFLDGDNNLSDYAKNDLKEMKALTATERVNFIVLYDQDKKKDTVLYQISGGQLKTLSQEETEELIFSNGEADMNDYQTLKRFGQWAVERYPARYIGLFMWDHGGGWKDGGESGGRASRCAKHGVDFRDFSWDDHSTLGSEVGIELAGGDYSSVLSAIVESAGQKLSIVGFDACLMGMWEVAAATAPYADYLLASEETEPADGWPWDKITAQLSSNIEMAPEEFGPMAVDAYHNEDESNSTLSFVDLNALNAVNARLSAFADALKADLADSTKKSKIKSIRGNTQEFEYSEHIDLKHFAMQIAEAKTLSETTRNAASDLVDSLSTSILANQTNSYSDWWSSYSYKNAYGMAIFFPESLSTSSYYGNYTRSDWTAYKMAPWADLSTWDEFVSAFLGY